MSTAQTTLIPPGCKYATEEEARLANLKNIKEHQKQDKYKQYQRQYQKEYQRKLRQQKKELEQQLAIIQQLQPNIIVTPNFILEIVGK